MFNKYIKTQYVCISVSELFDWWDRLDSDPDNAFELFTEFLENAEDTLDVKPNVVDDDFVPLTVCCEEDLFDSCIAGRRSSSSSDAGREPVNC